MALLLAGAVLAVLPALAGGLHDWVGERVEPPFAVVDPGADDPPDRGDDRDRDASGGSGRSGGDDDSGGGGSSGPG